MDQLIGDRRCRPHEMYERGERNWAASGRLVRVVSDLRDGRKIINSGAHVLR